MTTGNAQTNQDYDAWDDEFVDLIGQHAEAQDLDEKHKTKLSVQNHLCARLKAYDEIRKSDVTEKKKEVY